MYNYFMTLQQFRKSSVAVQAVFRQRINLSAVLTDSDKKFFYGVLRDVRFHPWTPSHTKNKLVRFLFLA